MAVMATQQPEPVAFEHKTIPAPSSDAMALDLEINGDSHHDTTTLDHESAPAPLETSNKPTDSSSAYNVAAPNLGVNGVADLNIHSFSSNEAIDATPSNPPTAQTTEEPSVDSLPDISNELPDASALISSAAIDAAVDDSMASSTVPPIVAAQESDLRDSQDVSTDLPSQIPSIEGENIPQTQSSLGDLPQSSGPEVPEPLVQESAPVPEVSSQDVEMADAQLPPPPSPTKVSREREDDIEIEPSAKRTKTEDSEGISSIPAAPDAKLTAPPNGDAAQSDAKPITEHESKEIIKIIKNALRTAAGKNFRAPVAALWPTFADQYLAKISNPIDLATIETNMRDKKYPSMGDFKADIQLLYDNAVTFNGVDHDVTRSAAIVRESILSKVATVTPEPVVVPKVLKKPPARSNSIAEPTTRAKPAPRHPRTSTDASSSAAPPAQTFALDPATNTPLIRRDSTKTENGRPKREIHPPKPRDLPYSVRPKNKKFATELRFCEEALNELKKPKHFQFAQHFLNPVDPVALNIPHYHTIIKNPMDISTIAKKLQTGAYDRAKNFETDVRLIFSNCYKFNPPPNAVRELGKQLENVFNEKWAQKDQWIAEHAPATTTPGSSGEEDDEESEEEEDEPQPPVQLNNEFRDRLLDEQKKLIELMGAKKQDPAQIELQKQIIGIIQGKVDEAAKAATTASTSTKKTPKKAKAKATKKTAATKKAGAPAKKVANRSKKYLGTLEKETISAGIVELPEEVSEVVLEMIKTDRPDVVSAEDGTIELDIDAISQPVLWQIYDMVMKHTPWVEEQMKKNLQEKEPPRPLARPPPKKKNKPMSKVEQERKIELLKNSVQEFERQDSHSQSLEPPAAVLPTVEDESSGDDDSDSEEE